MFNKKRLETYRATAGFAPTSGFAEADLLSLKTKLKTYRRSSLRGKLNALSKKPFEKWLRQSPISVNSCPFVVNFNYLCALGVLGGLNMNSFMQNKPNFHKNRVDINYGNTESCEYAHRFLAQNSQSQFPKRRNEDNLLFDNEL